MNNNNNSFITLIWATESNYDQLEYFLTKNSDTPSYKLLHIISTFDKPRGFWMYPQRWIPQHYPKIDPCACSHVGSLKLKQSGSRVTRLQSGRKVRGQRGPSIHTTRQSKAKQALHVWNKNGCTRKFRSCRSCYKKVTVSTRPIWPNVERGELRRRGN